MKFTPKTDFEILESNVLPSGIYKGEVFDAEDTDKYGNILLTKNGDPKIILTCRAIDNGNKLIKCNLTPAYMKLLKHFCDVSGLEENYKNGDLNADICKKVSKFFNMKLSRYEYKNDKEELKIINNIDDFLQLNEESVEFLFQ